MMENLKIGNLHLKHRTILAPMASLTDIVFRRVIDEIGGEKDMGARSSQLTFLKIISIMKI